MGEIADMMLDGTMCQGCGVWMDDILNGADAPGYPRFCGGCVGYQKSERAREQGQVKVPCPTCGKRVKQVGLKDHQRDAHGVRPAEPPSFSPNFDERNNL